MGSNYWKIDWSSNDYSFVDLDTKLFNSQNFNTFYRFSSKWGLLWLLFELFFWLRDQFCALCPIPISIWICVFELFFCLFLGLCLDLCLFFGDGHCVFFGASFCRLNLRRNGSTCFCGPSSFSVQNPTLCPMADHSTACLRHQVCCPDFRPPTVMGSNLVSSLAMSPASCLAKSQAFCRVKNQVFCRVSRSPDLMVVILCLCLTSRRSRLSSSDLEWGLKTTFNLSLWSSTIPQIPCKPLAYAKTEETEHC